MSDNRDHYYLRDAMGGHLGLIVDDDGDVSTQGHPAFSTYDAFGNAMTERSPAAGAFAWRGGEGSVTEREPDLVYMQARHYSPKIGRFIQADTNLTGSTTTQGMNRYAYAENNPVNASDPTGNLSLLAIIGLSFLVALIVDIFLYGSLLGHQAGDSAFGNPPLQHCSTASSVAMIAVLGLGMIASVLLFAGVALVFAAGGGIASIVLGLLAAALLTFLFGALLGYLTCYVRTSLCDATQEKQFGGWTERHAAMRADSRKRRRGTA